MSVKTDYDFIGFTYNGKHSVRDLKIYRTSTNNRYELNLSPTIADTTAENSGSDGMYFFNSQHRQKNFVVNFAFDQLQEADIRLLRQLFSGKQIGELSFDEKPYIVYDAKVSTAPFIKTVCFDTPEGNRVYKGEGTVSFVCYFPYGHTPTKLYFKENNEWVLKEADGRILSNYDADYYTSKNEWAPSSGLTDTIVNGFNPGDIPAPFKLKLNNVVKNTTITVGEFAITIMESCTDLVWDSKTGMVKGTIDNITRPISYIGNGLVALPPSKFSCKVDADEFLYQYWYY